MTAQALRRAAVFCGLLLSAACANPQKDARLAPAQGLIVIEAERVGLAKKNPYFLTFSRDGDGASLGESYRMDLLGYEQTARTFYVKAVPAGSYVWEAFNVGYAVSWGLCFNGGTHAFDVPAGQAVFLGSFDPNVQLADIRTGLPAALTMGTYEYIFDRTAPVLERGDEAKLAEAAAFIRREHPSIAAPLRPADLRPAKFHKGRPAFLARFPRCAQRR